MTLRNLAKAASWSVAVASAAACQPVDLVDATPECAVTAEQPGGLPSPDGAGRTAEDGWGIGTALANATGDAWTLTSWDVLDERRVTTEPSPTSDGIFCIGELDGWDAQVSADLMMDGTLVCTLARARFTLPVDTAAPPAWTSQCNPSAGLPAVIDDAVEQATASWTRVDEVTLFLHAHETVVVTAEARGVNATGNRQVSRVWSSDEG